MTKESHSVVAQGNPGFEPKIIAITCNFCTYAGADLAGTSRIQYPTNVRIIRVMCSGRVDPTFVLKALQEGADGVLIAGCHPGDCHFLVGNEKALRRYTVLSKMLKQVGLEPERVRLEWISASEGEKFAKVIRSMVQDLRRVGPNPYKNGLQGGGKVGLSS
ncbi:MAG: hydrogenase iron-sulfur subunit [Promethearchaeati archaeon SRVP18_Atabeyarchaeia-1]